MKFWSAFMFGGKWGEEGIWDLDWGKKEVEKTT
jgi:hypothetical protein